MYPKEIEKCEPPPQRIQNSYVKEVRQLRKHSKTIQALSEKFNRVIEIIGGIKQVLKLKNTVNEMKKMQ